MPEGIKLAASNGRRHGGAALGGDLPD